MANIETWVAESLQGDRPTLFLLDFTFQQILPKKLPLGKDDFGL